MSESVQHDPLQPHSHDNNIVPPSDDPSLTLHPPDHSQIEISLEQLGSYPQTEFAYQYHTDHGIHGPYQLRGVSLYDLIQAHFDGAYSQVEIISADGFGNRIFVDEVKAPSATPILLCTHSDDQPLTRQHGLIRLVVPTETDNALRQIKWVATIKIISEKTL